MLTIVKKTYENACFSAYASSRFFFGDTCSYTKIQKKIKKKKKEEVQEKDIQDDEEEVECTRTRGNPANSFLRARGNLRMIVMTMVKKMMKMMMVMIIFVIIIIFTIIIILIIIIFIIIILFFINIISLNVALQLDMPRP